MKKTIGGFLIALTMFFVSGCEIVEGLGGLTQTAKVGGGPFPSLAVVDGATIMATDKTVLDHIISLSSGKNCSTVRRELGMYYCEEDEPVGERKVYCYRTLGGVTCYDKPFHGRAALEDVKEPVRQR